VDVGFETLWRCFTGRDHQGGVGKCRRMDMKLNQSRLLVFDLDGTLVDTFEDITRAVNHVLGQFGISPKDVEEVRKYVGNGARELMAGVLGEKGGKLQIDKSIEIWRRYYLEHPADRSRLYPDVKKVLEILRSRSLKLAVFSNKLQEITEKVLEEVGILPLLDHVLGENSNFPRKPAPEGLIFLMKKFDAAPGTTWMVGDGEADVRVGLDAGCRVCGVSYGMLPRKRLLELGAHVVIDSFEDLLAQGG